MARNTSFHVAASVVPMLVLAYGLREAADFFRNVLYLSKRSGTVGRLALACALVNIALNLLLIPAFGFVGAAWCTLLTWALYLWVCLLAQRVEYDIPLPVFPLLPLVGWTVLCYEASRFVPDSSSLVRWGGNAGCIVLFLVPLAFSGYFTPEETRLARGWLAARLGRGTGSQQLTQ